MGITKHQNWPYCHCCAFVGRFCPHCYALSLCLLHCVARQSVNYESQFLAKLAIVGLSSKGNVLWLVSL